MILLTMRSPILYEYWFDNKDKAESLIENLNSSKLDICSSD